MNIKLFGKEESKHTELLRERLDNAGLQHDYQPSSDQPAITCDFPDGRRIEGHGPECDRAILEIIEHKNGAYLL